MTYLYSAKLKCKKCNKETRYNFSNGDWKCCVCDTKSKFGDAVSDIAKAATKSLNKK